MTRLSAKTAAQQPPRGVTAEVPTPSTRSVHIEIADNGYVVRISDSNYKEIELVFTSQSSMMKTVKEATAIATEEDK